MRIFPSALIAALTLGLTIAGSTSAVAQLKTSEHKKVLGYQDENGAFHPLNRALPDAATSTTVTGAITLTIHLTIKSSFPSGTKIYCSSDILAVSDNAAKPLSPVEYEEEAVSLASGSTCTTTVPYSWTIYPAGTGVTSSFSGGYTVFATSPSIPSSLVTFGARYSNSSFAEGVKMPATGTKTTYDIDVTI
jgi:hypothetical protein